MTEMCGRRGPIIAPWKHMSGHPWCHSVMLARSSWCEVEHLAYVRWACLVGLKYCPRCVRQAVITTVFSPLGMYTIMYMNEWNVPE